MSCGFPGCECLTRVKHGPDKLKRCTCRESGHTHAKAEEILQRVLMAAGNRVMREMVFHETRKWRLDVALPDHLIAVEIEGFGGRHQHSGGFRKDMEKHNELVLHGWRLLRVPVAHVENGRALELLARAGVRVTALP